MAFFWSRDKGKEIKNRISKIDKEVGKITDLEKKKSKFKAIISLAEDDIKKLEREILERAEEEKKKPWIDVKYDSSIDLMAREEIEAIKNLKKSLDELLEFIDIAGNEKELDQIIELVKDEENKIKTLESEHNEKITGFGKLTIKARITSSAISETPPSQNTSDRISWRDIATVARQLGGWVLLKGGRHGAAIYFPKGNRPIPLSSDVGSSIIASEFREQLTFSLPPHKLPTRDSLMKAFKKGDLKAA